MDDEHAMIPDDSSFKQLIEWIWVPMAGAIAWLWIGIVARNSSFAGAIAELDKMTDKRISLLEQHYLNIEAKLVEADSRRREDRQEIMDRIDRHHSVIYAKLDLLTDKLSKP